MISITEPMEKATNIPSVPAAAPTLAYHADAKAKPPALGPVMGSFARPDEVSHTAAQPYAAEEPPPAEDATDSGDNDQGTDEEAGIIRCICQCDDDDGFTIQCDRCLVWQHCACFGMSHASVPDEYLCEQCDPRPVNVEYARAVQRRRLQEEARKASKVRDATAAVTFFESAAQAAWNTAVHGESPPTSLGRRRATDGRTSPVRASESDKGDDAEPASSGRAKTKAKRGRSASRKTGSISIPAHLRGSDDEDYDKLESWQIEFSPITANIIRDNTTKQRLADYTQQWHKRTPLQADVDEQGWMIAPLRYVQDVHGELSNPVAGDPRYTKYGLAPIGHECIPISMRCASLSDYAARVYVRSISDQVTNNFFNNIMHKPTDASQPQKIWSASKTFCRPAMFGLFAQAAIPPGAFISEYCGEVYDAHSYRMNPINQYHQMGTCKPHVRMFPTPLHVVVDARTYGNIARFVRASCHPNAVVRPILQYTEREEPRWVLGLFAIAPIPKSHEITVGWDWDDQHIVHVLPGLVKRPWAFDDTPRFRSATEAKRQRALELEAFTQRGDFPYANTILATKLHVVMALLLSYATCGCLGPSLGGSSTNAFLMRRQNCAVTQMLRVSQGMPLLYTTHIMKSSTKAKPITLTPLVGVFRYWTVETPMTSEDHLRAKLAQNGCYVQRVMQTGDEPPCRNEADEPIDAEDPWDAGYASSATEFMEDGMAYASDEEDPIVTKAMDVIKQEQETSLSPPWGATPRPAAKKNDRRRARPAVAAPALVAEAPKARTKRAARPSTVPTRTESAAKRQKVRALFDVGDASSPVTSDEERERERSPSRHVRTKSTTPEEKSTSTRASRHVSPTSSRSAATPPVASPTVVPTSKDAVPMRTPTPPVAKTLLPVSSTPVVEAATVPAMEPTSASATPTAEPVSASTPPVPEPAPPPKRLSLAEYKKRLASRRQSEATNDAPSSTTPTGTSTPSNDSPVPVPTTPSLTTFPSTGNTATTPPSVPLSDRDAVRSVIIPQSPSPPHVPSPRAIAPTWESRAATLTTTTTTTATTVYDTYRPESRWSAPKPPRALSSTYEAPPPSAPPVLGGARAPPTPSPYVRAPGPPPSAPPPGPPPVPVARPPGPPPGPPPPRPPQLRTAPRPPTPPGWTAMRGGGRGTSHAPPSRSGAGFGRGGWRPI